MSKCKNIYTFFLFKQTLQSTTLFSDVFVSYLNQYILAKAREGIFEAIKSDVMPLPYSVAHTITHLCCALPLPVLTHAAKHKTC